MQVVVSLPDSGHPDVVFEVGVKSLVVDAAQAAADEWDIDAEFLEISFSGSIILSNSLLISHGVVAGSQLTASLLRVFGRKWFTDDGKREKLLRHLSRFSEQHLSLDTPSFATDGCFQFDMAWIPDGIEISFVNPHPSITSAKFREPVYVEDEAAWEKFPVSKVDLTGIKTITSTGDDFLSCCRFIAALDISSLSNVNTIGSEFLSLCTSLKSLDLTSFNNVTEIGGHFLSGCSSILSLNLAGLNNVTAIGEDFLARCSFTSLDLTDLSNVTTIGPFFLDECYSLTSLDLKSLNNVTTLGQYFVSRCPLVSIDVSGMDTESVVRTRIEESH